MNKCVVKKRNRNYKKDKIGILKQLITINKVKNVIETIIRMDKAR